MANVYKNAFYAPTLTAPETIYTCPTEARAIFQTVQLTNTGGNKTVKVYIYDNSATTQYLIAHAEITGPTICNLLKGSVVLEESDELRIETTDISGISGTAALLEVSRVYIADSGVSSFSASSLYTLFVLVFLNVIVVVQSIFNKSSCAIFIHSPVICLLKHNL